MVAIQKQAGDPFPHLTPQEYLEREKGAETKSEYIGGRVVAMAGASPEHNAIVFNLSVVLGSQLLGSPCRGFAGDLRVHTPACDRYSYPDLSVVCGEPRYEVLAGMRSLLNPTLLVEVLSASTEASDRGEKWTCYQTLESLESYVLISQHRPLVEIYRRQTDGWHYTAAIGLESIVALDRIGCRLPLIEIYAGIDFASAPVEQQNP